MSRSYSLSFLTVQEASPVEAVEIAAACGYDFVGLRILPAAASGEAAYPLLHDANLLREVQAALRDTGVKVADVEIVRLKDSYRRADFQPFVERAAALGAAHVLVAGDDTDVARLQDSYTDFCHLAAEYGLSADLEFMPWTAVKNLRQARAMVEQSGAANAGVLIDSLHFARSDSSLAEVADLPSDLIHYIQLCDAYAQYDDSDEGLIAVARGARLLPGSGELDLLSLAQLVDASKPIGLEIPNAELVQHFSPKQRAQMAIDHAQKLLATAMVGGE